MYVHFASDTPAFSLDTGVDLAAKIVRSDWDFGRISKLHRADTWDVSLGAKGDKIFALYESVRDDEASKSAFDLVRQFDQAGFAMVDRDRSHVSILLFLPLNLADRVRDLCAQMMTFRSSYVASFSIRFSNFRGDPDTLGEVKHGPTFEEFSDGALLTVVMSSFRIVPAEVGGRA